MPDGSNLVQLSSTLTPWRIQKVVMSFSPASTGQPECSVRPLSILPSLPKYEKKVAERRRGRTNTLALVKVVAPPSSGALQ